MPYQLVVALIKFVGLQLFQIIYKKICNLESISFKGG